MEDEYRYECQNCGALLRECDLPAASTNGKLPCPRCGQGPLAQVRQIPLPIRVETAPA